jgi:DNA (cytosine-5)-methyltransferase 1
VNRLLDLFCGAGGAAYGYHQAGFTEIVGVDIAPQPRYPFKLVQGDALEFLAGVKPGEYDLIHASPPCQGYSLTQRLWRRDHAQLIEVLRAHLVFAQTPYVIENVPGAPLLTPITLCGAMFGLRVYRHRLFETSRFLAAPSCPGHPTPAVKCGRPVRDGDFVQVVGHFSGVGVARRAMGIDWMTRDELSQAIPPAYTEWIGRQLLATL